MAHDWANTKILLAQGARGAFTNFFKVHPIETVRALGFTWEWGQAQACFYLVANTQAGLEQGMVDANRYQAVPLNADEAREKVRWSAGYFPFPAGLIDPVNELGRDWEAQADRLYEMVVKMSDVDTSNDAQYSEYSRQYEAFLAQLVTICCDVLADLAKQGVFQGSTDLDFYVGSTDENGEIVRDRDVRIRAMIAA